MREIQNPSINNPCNTTMTSQIRGITITLDQRLLQAERISPYDNNAATIAAEVPAGLTLNEPAMSPRVKCDHEVVIPQEGQGIFQITCHEHGGNPSCSCVPNPRESGFKHAATISSNANPQPQTAETALNCHLTGSFRMLR
jgi:hypothetical protein